MVSLFRRWFKRPDNRRLATSNPPGQAAERLEDREVPALNPFGGEFRVNQNDLGTEQFSSAALDNFGNAIFTFQRTGTATQNGIYYRIFNNVNAPVTGDVLISPLGRSASVAAYNNREFSVVWSQDINGDGAGDQILLERFDRNGNPVTPASPIQILAQKANVNDASISLEQPTIDATQDGLAVVVWRETNPVNRTVDLINFARISRTGGVSPTQTLAADVVRGTRPDPPSVGLNEDGDFVIAWVNQAGVPGTANVGPVFMQVFNASGVAIGARITVDATGFGVDADIANDDSLVAVWDDLNDANPGAGDDIRIQRYNPNRTLNGAVIAPGLPAPIFGMPQVAVDPDDRSFVVGYTAQGPLLDTDIRIADFDVNGNLTLPIPNPRIITPVLSPQQWISNTATAAAAALQTKHQLAMNTSGDFIITYHGSVVGPDLNGVAAQRFLGTRTISIADATFDPEGDPPAPPPSNPPNPPGTDELLFNVTLSAPSSTAITVTVNTTNDTATAGVDFVLLTPTITFAPGTTTQQVRVRIVPDTILENATTIGSRFGERFFVNLTTTAVGVTFTDAQATGLIVDDDTPVFSINDVTVNEAAGVANFTVTLSKTPNLSAVAVDVIAATGTNPGAATLGADFGQVTVPASRTVLIAQNATGAALTAVVTVPIINDLLSEVNENFLVILQNARAVGGANPVGIADGTGVGTIIDNEPPQIIFPDQNPRIAGPEFEAREGDAPNAVTVTLTLNKAVTVNTTINVSTLNGSAIAGVDYTPLVNLPVTFLAGQAQTTFTVTFLGNITPQPDRNFFFRFTVNPANIFLPNGTGVVTQDLLARVLDDDGVAIYMIDTSRSMESVGAQDINLNGDTDAGDDINGNGIKGDLIDLAIVGAEQHFAASALRRASIIIFGRDAKALDASAVEGFQTVIEKGVDSDLQGGNDFSQILRTIRIGAGGAFAQSNIDPSRTYYDRPLEEMFRLNIPIGIIGEGILITDGSGILSTNAPILTTLAAQGIDVSALVLGPYRNTGPTTDIDRIVNATGGVRGDVSNVVTTFGETPASDPGAASQTQQPFDLATLLIPDIVPPPSATEEEEVVVDESLTEEDVDEPTLVPDDSVVDAENPPADPPADGATDSTDPEEDALDDTTSTV